MRREERVTVQGPCKGAKTRRNVTQGVRNVTQGVRGPALLVVFVFKEQHVMFHPPTALFFCLNGPLTPFCGLLHRAETNPFGQRCCPAVEQRDGGKVEQAATLLSAGHIGW